MCINKTRIIQCAKPGCFRELRRLRLGWEACGASYHAAQRLKPFYPEDCSGARADLSTRKGSDYCTLCIAQQSNVPSDSAHHSSRSRATSLAPSTSTLSSATPSYERSMSVSGPATDIPSHLFKGGPQFREVHGEGEDQHTWLNDGTLAPQLPQPYDSSWRGTTSSFHSRTVESRQARQTTPTQASSSTQSGQRHGTSLLPFAYDDDTHYVRHTSQTRRPQPPSSSSSTQVSPSQRDERSSITEQGYDLRRSERSRSMHQPVPRSRYNTREWVRKQEA